MVATTFIISNNQKTYTPEQIWVSFDGSLTTSDTVGGIACTDAGWQSFQLSAMQAEVSLPYFSSNPLQYTFSLDNFNGRIYVNYGAAALTASPNPGQPGNVPYIVFETTVLPSNSSNIDLSYVDGISAAAGTMLRDATTGAALLATSVNPVSASPDIVSLVAAQVPDAVIRHDKEICRVMSASASPSSYHDWTALLTSLQTSTSQTPLTIADYTSPAKGLPAKSELNGVLFGYSGAPAITGQLSGFNQQQSYTLTATFQTDLNPDSDPTLTRLEIPKGTAGVLMTGSGTVSGTFSIYITNAAMNAGTGIYGNNPAYVVVPSDSTQGSAYATNGIYNDLSGRIVGDLMAGIVFGWSNSATSIADNAKKTNTNLYGMTFSSDTVSGIKTGELFFLLSLAATQGKLSDWIGAGISNNLLYYDPYLYAVSQYTYAYASGFTDRLQGFANPDTYWYTSNPPAIPWNAQENFPLIGFVQLTLGPTKIDYTVQANQAWQDTGIAVQADSKIRVEYLSGSWTADPNTDNGNLYDAAGCPGLIMKQSGYPSVDADLKANMGALMGRIGGEGGKVIQIGNGPVSLPAGYSGNLELCINDDLKGHYGAGLTDNQGAVCVSIQLG